jgi:hypothetical protein
MKRLLLVLILIIGAFFVWRGLRSTPEPTPRPPSVAPASGTPKAVPQSQAISGSSLNRAFPEAEGAYDVAFTQEKDGFSQADIVKEKAKVATLSVSDTAANPSARDKFKTSTRKIGGYPVAAVGSMGTALLVGDRYQVQVRSLVPAFTAADRDAWLARCRLGDLAKLAELTTAGK